MSTSSTTGVTEHPLRILLANALLKERTGCEMYTYEMALELKRLGHVPAVFTSVRGALGDRLAQEGVAVVTRLSMLDDVPDVIQGHAYLETMCAVRAFPTTPAIHVCHDSVAWLDRTPLHPRILFHFGVSELCAQRVVRAGVPADQVQLLLNWVNTRRFLPRPALPPRPLRALVFSNYAHEESHLPAVREACQRAGVALDVVGSAAGKPSECPEALLGDYDLVFAKGKAALEALAIGCAVILCDFGGAGPLVTSADFARLRPLNFGLQALVHPLRFEFLLEQIERYDAEDAARVCRLIRLQASLESAAQELLQIYRATIAKWGDDRRSCSAPTTKTYVSGLKLSLKIGRDRLLTKSLLAWIDFKRHPRMATLRGNRMVRALARTKARLFPYR